MHSMQRIDATSCCGSRLSTHFSSGKTASISNRKMYINNVVNNAQNNVSRINNNRREETVASRIQLKREQDLKSFVVQRIGSERVRFSRSRRGCFARVSKVLFFFLSSRNNPATKTTLSTKLIQNSSFFKNDNNKHREELFYEPQRRTFQTRSTRRSTTARVLRKAKTKGNRRR